MSVCVAFKWVGQPITSCDDCGKPAWEHVGMERLRRQADPFGTEGWFNSPWPHKQIDSWETQGLITPQRAVELKAAAPGTPEGEGDAADA